MGARWSLLGWAAIASPDDGATLNRWDVVTHHALGIDYMSLSWPSPRSGRRNPCPTARGGRKIHTITYINIRNGHGHCRDGIAPLVVVGEGQTMHHIKAENKGFKAMRRL